MTIVDRTKVLFAAAAETSRPVRVFLVVEATAALGVALVLGKVAAGVAGSIAVDDLPPWRVLAVVPALGAAAELVRATQPVAVLRRWHGVLVRRIDERWADER
jgi:hypothetical protein